MGLGADNKYQGLQFVASDIILAQRMGLGADNKYQGLQFVASLEFTK